MQQGLGEAWLVQPSICANLSPALHALYKRGSEEGRTAANDQQDSTLPDEVVYAVKKHVFIAYPPLLRCSKRLASSAQIHFCRYRCRADHLPQHVMEGGVPAFGWQVPKRMLEVAEEEVEAPLAEQGILSSAAAPSEYDLGTTRLSAPEDFDASQQGMDGDQFADMGTPFVAEEPLSPPSSSK